MVVYMKKYRRHFDMGGGSFWDPPCVPLKKHKCQGPVQLLGGGGNPLIPNTGFYDITFVIRISNYYRSYSATDGQLPQPYMGIDVWTQSCVNDNIGHHNRMENRWHNI